MNKLIIVEGTRGVGKTTITNWLRETIPYTNLMRLCGVPGKDLDARDRVKKARTADMEYLKDLEGTELNVVLDRSFISEHVYCLLGYKNYKFDDVFNYLMTWLADLEYEIHLIYLYNVNRESLEQRLKRDKANYQDIKFSIDDSINQQAVYSKVMDYLEDRYEDSINVHRVDTSMNLEDVKDIIKCLIDIE